MHLHNFEEEYLHKLIEKSEKILSHPFIKSVNTNRNN